MNIGAYMRLKLLCLLCSVLAVLMFCPTVVSAVGYDDVRIDATKIGENEEDNTITVRFSLNGLQDTRGAAMIEAHINYDETELELVSVTANHPDGWAFDKQYAEDWTKIQVDEQGNPIPQIYFTVMNLLAQYLVKEDNVLYCDAVFKVLKEEDEYQFDFASGYWSTYEGSSLVRVNLEPATLSLNNKKIEPVASSEEESSAVSYSEDDVTVIEEKPFDTNKLIKILIASGSGVLAVCAGILVYHFRKKKRQ